MEPSTEPLLPSGLLITTLASYFLAFVILPLDIVSALLATPSALVASLGAIMTILYHSVLLVLRYTERRRAYCGMPRHSIRGTFIFSIILTLWWVAALALVIGASIMFEGNPIMRAIPITEGVCVVAQIGVMSYYTRLIHVARRNSQPESGGEKTVIHSEETQVYNEKAEVGGEAPTAKVG